MLTFLLRRLLQALLALLVISALVFTMMYCVGDPVAMLLPPTATQRDREDLRRTLGLDRPLPAQYFRFLARLAHGDLGHSYYSGEPVARELARRLPATLELALAAMALAIALGVPLGIAAGARPRHPLSRLAMGGSLLGISLPTFWLGLMLMMVFGVWLEWLPAYGRGRTRLWLGVKWSVLTLDGWRHLILPALTLALYHLAILMRLVRSEMAHTLAMPFIRVCRARGLSEGSIVLRHALRNTLIPVVTVAGLQLGGLLAFSVVTETVFQWPGLGKLLIDRIQVDRPLVVAYLMMTGVVFIALNLLVDLTYGLIDPRIRWAGAGRTAGK
jgi:peptide/nickel transport system permease protein